MSDFVPLTTFQGLSPPALAQRVNGRDVFLWGSGFLGRTLKRVLDRNGIHAAAFCDSDSGLHSKLIEGIPVVSPEAAVGSVRSGNGFLIIASSLHRHEIEERCLAAGLTRDVDFLSYIKLSRPEAAVDVSGSCNLRCPSCPRGNMAGQISEGLMPAAVYKKVLDKLMREVPSLSLVDLSTWGEPFVNPELAAIVRMTEGSVPCRVSTNLQLVESLEEVIAAAPGQLVVSAGGCGRSYERRHAGASWSAFVENVRRLKRLRERHRTETQFTLLVHRYRDAASEDLDTIKALCLENGMRFATTWAYLNPYDKLLDYCRGSGFDPESAEVLKELPWDFDKALELAKKDAQKPCLCQRIFPVITWDLSVSLCHLYVQPVVAGNFLETPLEELLKMRHAHPHCTVCQRFGLHRLDIEVLLRKNGAEDIMVPIHERRR